MLRFSACAELTKKAPLDCTSGGEVGIGCWDLSDGLRYFKRIIEEETGKNKQGGTIQRERQRIEVISGSQYPWHS